MSLARPKRHCIIELAKRDYRAEIVAINERGVDQFSYEVYGELPSWDWFLPEATRKNPESALAFLILTNSLNYRFWHRQDDGSIVKYRHGDVTGSTALFSAMRDTWGDSLGVNAFREHLIDAQWVRAHLGDIPDPESRAIILNDLLEGDKLERAANQLYGFAKNIGVITAICAEDLASLFPIGYGADDYRKKALLMCAATAGVLTSMGLPLTSLLISREADSVLRPRRKSLLRLPLKV